MEDRYLQTKKQKIKLQREYEDAAILDIGGGGEGFIGRLYGKNVIAIDPREDELLETDNDSIKLIMDGRALKFTDENFDVVTLFYSLMYMNIETKLEVLSEAVRVLKRNGLLDIWDVDLPDYKNDGKDVFVAQLDVELEDDITSTGYGVLLEGKKQSKSSIDAMLEPLGLKLIKEECMDQSFRLQYKKL
ncbi:class I SAM-dependent methyltransferase [Acidaminobacter sp. JC074]|uniref:class I SAM-dependent methyltransferase n=1 Tax=Acidaminobacter sp. JC074 TaxID=2530199 RepID=UPI001F10674D|nr:class I SAM-dependent methyltransferase [Acidaminobacter sp. JC074]